MAKKKNIEKEVTSIIDTPVIAESTTVEPTNTIANITKINREKLMAETKQAVLDRPTSTVIDYNAPFPVAECRVCHTYTPLFMVCKHCGIKDPHRDIVINKEGK